MEKSIESVVEDMSRVKEEKKRKIRILGAWLEVVRAPLQDQARRSGSRRQIGKRPKTILPLGQ